jgi:hypothetical protein
MSARAFLDAVEVPETCFALSMDAAQRARCQPGQAAKADIFDLITSP